MFRFVFFALLLCLVGCFGMVAHPVSISKSESRKKAKSSIEAEVVFTSYGYRPLKEIEPSTDTEHTNPLKRIHPLVWTALFTFSAVGLAYWLADYEKKMKAWRKAQTRSASTDTK